MRLPTFRQRFSYHCIAYSLLMTSAASCLVISHNAVAASATQRYAIAAGPLDNALSQFAAAANVILSFSPQQTSRLRSIGLNGNFTVDQGFGQAPPRDAATGSETSRPEYRPATSPSSEIVAARSGDGVRRLECSATHIFGKCLGRL